MIGKLVLGITVLLMLCYLLSVYYIPDQTNILVEAFVLWIVAIIIFGIGCVIFEKRG